MTSHNTPQTSVANDRQDATQKVGRFARSTPSKIHPYHLEKLAIVYVRQSTQHQVLEHRESNERQYALVDRAIELGWPPDRILVIDEDQGQSGRRADNRSGFQRLLLEVNLDHVGLILGLEMSRLARSNKDWHHLLEVCAIFRTLLADTDGIYDPNDPNDRMLLGLKGTISEVELHTLRNRLTLGLNNKANRAELFTVVPIGYVRVPKDKVTFDPDEQVQSVVRIIHEKFEELGSASAVLQYLVKNKIRVGIRHPNGINRGPVAWNRPSYSTILAMLHNPMYAGAYARNRRTTDPRRKGKAKCNQIMLPMEEWVLIHDAVPAYITWQQFLANQEKLTANHARMERMGSNKNGPALLPGLLRCGHCGARMVIAYKRSVSRYSCIRRAVSHGDDVCQNLQGNPVEELVEEKVLQALQPASLELSLAAANDIQREQDRLHNNWQQRLERTQYDSERAKRQYDTVEPENRLVARELEKNWESSLREHQLVTEEYERYCATQPQPLTSVEVDSIRSLAADIPSIWNADTTTSKDRKAIVRQLVEKVVATADAEYVDVSIHWAGGFVSQHQVMQPVGSFTRLHDYERFKQRVLELHLAGWPYRAICEQLVKEKFHSPTGLNRFSRENLRTFLVEHCAEELGPSQPPFRRFLEKDEWLAADLAREIEVKAATLHFWRRRDWLHARRLPSRRWIIWANQEELDRLRKLRDTPIPYGRTYPLKLTTPIKKPD